MEKSAVGQTKVSEKISTEKELMESIGIRSLLDFVEKRKTANREILEKAIKEFGLNLYRALGLPDTEIRKFVQTRFANNAERKRTVLNRYGVDLKGAKANEIVQLMTAVIFVQGDFQDLRLLHL